MIIPSIKTGMGRATRSWQMIALLVVGSILFAAPVALLVLTAIISTSGGTQTAVRMLGDKLDVVWLIDFINGQFPGANLTSLATQVGLTFLSMTVLYLLANALFTGGIIAVLSAPRAERFSMRTFCSGAGTYFWRFIRLWLISLAGYSAVFIIYWVALAVIENSERLAMAEGPIVLKRWGATFLLLLGFGLVNMTFDYARIITARSGSRRMFRETAAAIRFVSQGFWQVSAIYLVIAIVAATLFFLTAAARSSVPQSSMILVLVAFLIGQATIATKMWSKVAFYAAEMDLYDRVVPRDEIITAVVPIAPEFAVAVEERVTVPRPKP